MFSMWLHVSDMQIHKHKYTKTASVKVTHVLNVATGVEIDRGGSSIVEQRVELLDIPEQTIDESERLYEG